MVDLSAVEPVLLVGCIETVAFGEPADQVCFAGEPSWAIAGAEFGWGFVSVGAG